MPLAAFGPYPEGRGAPSKGRMVSPTDEVEDPTRKTLSLGKFQHLAHGACSFGLMLTDRK